MPSLARRNLLHDRVRLVVTLTGIVFAVVLSAIQLGLFVGFTARHLRRHRPSGADIWVTSTGVTHLESAVPFSERKLYRVLGDAGRRRGPEAHRAFGQWKRPDGAQEGIMLVGVEPGRRHGQPWNLVAGRLRGSERAPTR